MIASHFAEDDNHQLSVRYDDILIDSRKSPVVVLDTDKSNPWAIAHLANLFDFVMFTLPMLLLFPFFGEKKKDYLISVLIYGNKVNDDNPITSEILSVMDRIDYYSIVIGLAITIFAFFYFQAKSALQKHRLKVLDQTSAESESDLL